MNQMEVENVKGIEAVKADDALWVQKAREGDPSSWAELHREYYPRLWSVVNQIVLDASTTEDVVQEAFIKAYKQIDRFRGQSKFGTWIYRIAVNQALDAVRKRSRQQRWLSWIPWNQEENEEEPIQQIAEPEKHINENERGDLREALKKALQSLSAEHRVVVELRLIQGLSTDETAKILKCKRGTVLSRLFYSCQKLQPLLRKTYEEHK